MDTRSSRHHDLEDSDNSAGDSSDTKLASTSSSKRGRRAIQKRVVSVPIRDVEGARVSKAGDQMNTPPPSDSWAWRKYGQKPIKGSPYPRGYYRCSSSKGCPARKQVERSRVDPKMLMVTYYCEHNHNWPAAKASHHRTATFAAASVKTPISEEEEDEEEEEDGDEEEEEEEKPRNILSNQSHSHDQVAPPENKFSANIGEAPPLIHNAEFGWFADFDSTSFTMLESPMLTDSTDSEMAMIFTMREEDESLFADLGELPECSTVFRRGLAAREEEQRRQSLATTS